MRIAFYAPMKPMDHATASGDRQMARALANLLRRLGHDVVVPSRLRTYDGTGSALRQERLGALGERAAQHLIRRWRNRPPELWISYHVYHKAPDPLGPAVSRQLQVPYVIIEASVAHKQATGRWAAGYHQSLVALSEADLVLALTRNDLAGIEGHMHPAASSYLFPPFLDATPYTAACKTRAAHRAVLARRLHLDQRRTWLITVAMMRADVKRTSYLLLADALGLCLDWAWDLLVVGDGVARPEIEARLGRLGSERIRFLGAVPEADLAGILAACDIFVWPACNEAYGMAMLEAQATGLPVIAGNEGGVPEIVSNGVTGYLVAQRDPRHFAAAIMRLLVDEAQVSAMGSAARGTVAACHDLPLAEARLADALAIAQSVPRGAPERTPLRICMIRHATTSWNEAGKIQGRRDIPLSASGHVQAAGWRLPDSFVGCACMTSPLSRARETAAILGFANPIIDARLAEMHWGEFEGRLLDELRDELGDELADNEARGLDFRPPGGESPREVAVRVASLFDDVVSMPDDLIIIAHKGILRSVVVLTTGWDMLGQPPVTFDPERALLIELTADGSPILQAIEPLR